MSLLLGLEPFQKFVVVVVGGGWSKGVLGFRFGPKFGLRLEAGTKLNNKKFFLDFIWWRKMKNCRESQVKPVSLLKLVGW